MQHIIQHLFQAGSLEEVSRERLEELVSTYPSFGVGRYLLSRKLHTEQAGQFAEETQRTNLYFTNPFWLQWLLQQGEEKGEKGALRARQTPLPEKPVFREEGNGREPMTEDRNFQEKLPVVENKDGADGPAMAAKPDTDTKAGPEEAAKAPDAAAKAKEYRTDGPTVSGELVSEEVTPGELIAGEQVFEELIPGEQVSGEPVSEELVSGKPAISPEPAVLEEPVPLQDAAPAGDAVAEEIPDSTSRPEHAEEPGAEQEVARAVSQPPISAADALLQHLAKARGLRQTLVTMNDQATGPVEGGEAAAFPEAFSRTEEAMPEGEAIQGAPAEEGTKVSSGQEETPASTEEPGIHQEEVGAPREEPVIHQEETAITREEPGTHQEGPVLSQEESTIHQEKPAVHQEASTMHQKGATLNQEAPASIVSQAMALAEPVVAFEPYHTIDYFASVGIKFVQEENPSDKLGKQLKSFTEWLKVMRKLPQKNQEIIPDMAAEHQIQAIAAHSVKGKEVLTETMAEVLVKQGMREKAMEVYRKLSLLNPEKSAYFATKIEQLKID